MARAGTKPNAVGKAIKHGSYDPSAKIMKETAAMGVAHRTDSIANYDVPHAMVHINAGLKAKTLPLAKEHLKHVKGHVKNIKKMASTMAPRVKALPGVKKELSDLDKVKTIMKK